MSSLYEEPSSITYTIYSKSGCPGCKKVKELLKSENPIIIDCDEYILDNKQNFLDFIENIAGKPVKMFPIVFNKNKEFIGGYNDTKEVYNNFDLHTDF